MNDALANLIHNMLKREGYTVTQAAAGKGWLAYGLLPEHRKDKPYRTEDEAWKACQNDYYYRKEHRE